MKLSLIATQGKGAGKVIPIPMAQFVIGRDPQCHLRPASPLISKRHCALLIRGNKAFVQDFGSTNGTQVNDQPVKGEVEIHNEDRLRIGPLAFVVRVENVQALTKIPGKDPSKSGPLSTPPSEVKASASSPDEDSVADMLLEMGVPGGIGPREPGAEDDSIMSTIMEMPAITDGPLKGNKPGQNSTNKDAPSEKKESSSFVARKILEKYQRRSR